MLNSLTSIFAAESGPTVHIAPGGVLTIHGFTITNSMLYAWVCSILFLVIFIYIARRLTMRPKGGFTQIVEVGTEFVVNTL